MKQLTDKQADRCRIACEWKRVSPKQIDALGATRAACWIEPNRSKKSKQVMKQYTELPTDPYFWIGRLWEALQKRANGKTLNCYSRGLTNNRSYEFLIGSKWLNYPNRNICEALCEAIEACTKTAESEANNANS